MYKHYYMKQYNCVFCAFPLLSVCLTSFAQILTTNENWILFLAFLKIMWTIFGCKWHFPSRDTTYDIEHDKKECQERRNWSRRIKVSQEDGQNWSCGSISVFVCIFWTNDLICIIVKTWENISSLFSLSQSWIGWGPISCLLVLNIDIIAIIHVCMLDTAPKNEKPRKSPSAPPNSLTWKKIKRI